MRTQERSGLARWHWSLALAAGAFVIGLAPLADGDLWWHLAAGRELVRTHTFLMTDPFSSGAAGRPWIDVHWLFQLAVYGIHALGGLRALIIAKCALVAAGALVLSAAVARSAGLKARAVFVPVFLVAIFMTRGLLLLRPIIPTLVFVSLFFFLLERFRQEGRLALLAPLPLLQIAWANVQALSMLGPALVSTYAVAMGTWALLGEARRFPFARECAPSVDAGQATRRLIAVLALCLAACFVTPYGAHAVALPFSLLQRLLPTAGNAYSGNIAENVPPFSLEKIGPGYFGHVSVYLGLLALCLAASRRLLLSHVVVVIALVSLALAGNRNVLLLYWLATPIAIISVTPTLRRLRVTIFRRRATFAPRWVGRATLVGVMIAATTAAARETSLAEAAPWRAPVESARVIGARGGAGSIFGADQFGGYLIWTLGPRFRPYMDTRLVLRSKQEFAEYLAVVDDPTLFDAWERDKGFEYVVLPVSYPDRYLPLIAHLYASDRWALIYTDGSETLFALRSNSIGQGGTDAWNLGSVAVTDRILASLAQRFADVPRLLEMARVQLATLEITVGEASAAERALAGLATPAAEALRARCRLAVGDLDGAAAVAELALARDASDIRSLDVMAVVAARRGDSMKALGFLHRALEVDPFDGEAAQLLARWEDHDKSQ
jgi:hypothetical protein